MRATTGTTSGAARSGGQSVPDRRQLDRGPRPADPADRARHIGYSKGNPGLGPNGTSLSPTGSYWDWNAGVDWNFYKNLTLSATYIDTDIGKRESFYLAPNFRKTSGGLISDPTVVFSLTAAF